MIEQWLKAIDEDYLIEFSNRGIVNRAKKDLEKNNILICEEKENCVICTIDDVVCTIKGDIKEAKCTCPSRTICKHIVMSYLYLRKQMTIDEEEVKRIKEELIPKEIEEKSKDKHKQEEKTYPHAKKIAKEIMKMLEEIMIIGLSRTSDGTLEKLETMAIYCHNFNLPNLEKNFRDMKEELSLYISKNSAFEIHSFITKICNLYQKAFVLINTQNNSKIAEIAGEFKSHYNEIAPIYLYGVVAEEWNNKSGYSGITYYFLEKTTKEWYSFTQALPTYYENLRIRQSIVSPWNLNCNSKELSNVEIKLIHAKVNEEKRISSSNETQGEVLGKSNLFDMGIKLYENWKELFEDCFVKNKKNATLIFLKADKWNNCKFDQINQKLLIDLVDMQDNQIYIEIQFSINTKNMIRILERLYKLIIKKNKMGKNTPILCGKIYLDNSKIKLYPLSYYTEDGESENLTLN